MLIGSVYFRKCLDLQYLLEMLQDTLDQLKAQQHFDILVLGGDMNAKIGLVDVWPEEIFVGLSLNSYMSTTDKTVCGRGRILTNFMADNNLVFVNGRYLSDSPAQPTFDERGTSIIDLIWVDATCLHYIQDLAVLLEPTLSDHRPVCLSLNISTNNYHMSSQQAKTVTRVKLSNIHKNDYQLQLHSTEIPEIYNLQTQQIYELLRNVSLRI